MLKHKERTSKRVDQMGSTDLYADLVLVNGKIITVDEDDSVTEAVAVKMGQIVKVGTSEEVEAMAGEGTTRIDLKGRAVLPGLTDCHVHMISGGTRALDKSRVDCRDFYHPEIKSIEDVLERMREQAKKTEKGEWVVAVGSPMQDLRFKEGRFPTRWDLDKATPDHPAFISFGAHITVANSLALEEADLTSETPNPVAGLIVKEESGELTGLLREKAQNLVSNLTSPGGKEIIEDAIRRGVTIPGASSYTFKDLKDGARTAVQRCLERGVTTVHDIVTSAEEIRAYQEVLEEGDLKMRIHLLVRAYESRIKAESILDMGLKTGFGNDWLKIGGVKLSIDGGMTGCNAAFYEPYTHEPWNTGVVRIPQETLDDLVDRFHRAGHRLVVHAIGDRAFDMILGAYEKALTAAPREDHRHRIEHGPANYLCTPERLEKMKKLDIFPVPNINFLYYFGDPLYVTLGEERMEHAFPFKMLLEEGIRFSSGTDAPGYMPVDVLRDIWTCVARRSWDGAEVSPEEAISVMDAIRLFTINAAYAGFEEDVKGSIEPGKLADLTVLHEDILTVDPDTIKDIAVDYTIVDGEIVYER
jgi:predicted amidohydrolase YtcJ